MYLCPTCYPYRVPNCNTCTFINSVNVDTTDWHTDQNENTKVVFLCSHEYVNVSFSHIRMVCKHCDEEQ